MRKWQMHYYYCSIEAEFFVSRFFCDPPGRYPISTETERYKQYFGINVVNQESVILHPGSTT